MLVDIRKLDASVVSERVSNKVVAVVVIAVEMVERLISGVVGM